MTKEYYRIELRFVCSDGYISGWWNCSKKYDTIRRMLQGLDSIRKHSHNGYSISNGITITHILEYRPVHFYNKI